MGSRDSGIMMPLISCTALLILLRRLQLVAAAAWAIKICLPVKDLAAAVDSQ